MAEALIAEWRETDRRHLDEECDFPVEVACPCRRDTVRLWFNGGELDAGLCSCGRWRVLLEHRVIDLVRQERVDAPEPAEGDADG